jgi:uroporphyrinogen decarboxylase
MTPRERVLMALEQRQPDRVPCDFWAEEPTWRRLFEHVGYGDKDRLLDELEIDVRHVGVPALPEQGMGGGVFQNFWGERYIYRSTPWGPMREDVRGALAEATRLSDLESFHWPTPDLFDYSCLPAECRRLENHALLYGFADVWQRPALVRGWEGMFVDMLERPEWVHFLSQTFTDFYRVDYTRAAEMTNGRIDLYLLISDLGSQFGPLISLDMFRQFVAPYLRQMIECIHNLGGKVLYHSCGSIRPFIPDLIALGVDVLDPIQPTGPEMSPERLRAEFAGQISFHGGIDMQHLLTRGTPEQVRAEVRRYRDVLGSSGGYILGPTHLFQPDVPPENILAVYGEDRRVAAASCRSASILPGKTG